MLIDKFDQDNNIVFADLDSIKEFNLNGCKLFMDYTFKTLSSQFHQLFVVHTLREDVSFPSFYFFLNNKSFLTYQNILSENVLKVQENDIVINISMMLIDFEEAIYKAIRDVIPKASIKGCCFHFARVICIKCQTPGF